MKEQDTNTIRDDVRKQYGKIGELKSGMLTNSGSSACCGSSNQTVEILSKMMGYSEKDMAQAPIDANMGLGCGNPKAIASLKHGETVLDLGSGGGFDCFLAAKEVGEFGKVIGVDMTPEMVSLARKNAAAMNTSNVEFRLGEMEHLPAADNSVDVIMSNCAINLSPEKQKVFQEAFRILKPGGRLAISDIVALKPLPESIKNNPAMICGCIGGTELVDNIRKILKETGFAEVSIDIAYESRKLIGQWFPGQQIEEYVSSATIQAIKPA